jgi:hypothetical protein
MGVAKTTATSCRIDILPCEYKPGKRGNLSGRDFCEVDCDIFSCDASKAQASSPMFAAKPLLRATMSIAPRVCGWFAQEVVRCCHERPAQRGRKYRVKRSRCPLIGSLQCEMESMFSCFWGEKLCGLR